MKEDGSNQGLQQSTSQWAEILRQLFDRLTGKSASVSYSFENLVIDIPRAQGPGGQDLGSAKWTINGRIVINAETYENEGAPSMKASAQTAA